MSEIVIVRGIMGNRSVTYYTKSRLKRRRLGYIQEVMNSLARRPLHLKGRD